MCSFCHYIDFMIGSDHHFNLQRVQYFWYWILIPSISVKTVQRREMPWGSDKRSTHRLHSIKHTEKQGCYVSFWCKTNAFCCCLYIHVLQTTMRLFRIVSLQENSELKKEIPLLCKVVWKSKLYIQSNSNCNFWKFRRFSSPVCNYTNRIISWW